MQISFDVNDFTRLCETNRLDAEWLSNIDAISVDVTDEYAEIGANWMFAHAVWGEEWAPVILMRAFLDELGHAYQIVEAIDETANKYDWRYTILTDYPGSWTPADETRAVRPADGTTRSPFRSIKDMVDGEVAWVYPGVVHLDRDGNYWVTSDHPAFETSRPGTVKLARRDGTFHVNESPDDRPHNAFYATVRLERVLTTHVVEDGQP